jgi:hypothetical protein
MIVVLAVAGVLLAAPLLLIAIWGSTMGPGMAHFGAGFGLYTTVVVGIALFVFGVAVARV